MLRRGLTTCSTFAVSAISRAGWRDLVPDLARAVAADDDDFRAHAILALKDLGDSADLTDELIAALSSGFRACQLQLRAGILNAGADCPTYHHHLGYRRR